MTGRCDLCVRARRGALRATAILFGACVVAGVGIGTTARLGMVISSLPSALLAIIPGAAGMVALHWARRQPPEVRHDA